VYIDLIHLIWIDMNLGPAIVALEGFHRFAIGGLVFEFTVVMLGRSIRVSIRVLITIVGLWV